MIQAAPTTNETTIYIAGPMTGLPDLNYPAFNQKAAELRAQGFDVRNPAELKLPPGTGWGECIQASQPLLWQCAAIYMLSGWQTSRGARIEHLYALGAGLDITYEKPPLQPPYNQEDDEFKRLREKLQQHKQPANGCWQKKGATT